MAEWTLFAADTYLAAKADAADATLTLGHDAASAHNTYPAVPFRLVLEPDEPNVGEEVVVTALAGPVATVTRAISGTTAVAHRAGVAARFAPNAGVEHGLGLVADPAQSNAATTAVTTTETKDGGVGDVAFVAVAGHQYRVKYVARAQSDTASTTVSVNIRDGGASSPTNTSTLRTAASIFLAGAAGAGASQLVVEQVLKGLAAGVHTVAAFYVRAAGAGQVLLGQATGQLRELTVEDVGAPA